MNQYSFESVKIGLSEKFTVTTTENMLNMFLEISGDVNPLHIYKDFAIKEGFKDKVVYGMLTSSFYSRLVGVYLPGKYGLLQGIQISFHAPVYVGDKLEISGEVVYINEAYKQIEINASIKNQENKKVSKAKIKVGFNECR